MQPITTLSIVRLEGHYLIRLERPEAPQASVPAYALSRDLRQELAESIDQAAALLQYLHTRHQALPASHPSSATSNPLQRLGWQMYRALPLGVREALRRLETPLLISTNDSDLPWELLHDGDRFLALAHPVARRMVTSAPVHRGTLRQQPGTWKALFIADPTGDLDGATEEVQALADLVERQVGRHPVRIICRRRATRKAVLSALSSGEYDLIHYAGHAFFNRRDPGASGLALAQDEILTAQDIREALNGQPIVFLNACQSIRGQAIRGQAPGDDEAADPLPYAGLNTYGLASAFIAGGARAFVGTLWPVRDDGSHKLARRFYHRALRGEMIGEALRRAREEARRDAPSDPTWASFALYGDPRLRLVEIKERMARPASILSAEIVGLPALYDRLGDEAASEIAGKCLERLRRELTARRGKILTLTHSVVTAAFGAVTTREDHVHLALRTALKMRHTLACFNEQLESGEGLRLSLRIGVEAGDVVVRETGTANDEPLTVLSPVFDSARALRDRANTGQILVGERAHKEATDTFDFAPGPGDDTAQAYDLLGIKSKRERIFSVAAAGERSRFTGREEALDVLRACWDRCRTGHRQVIGLVGEAGVGKSRLLHEFAQLVDDTEASWLLGICEAHRQGTPFSWLAQITRDLFGIDPSDVPQSADRKLRNALTGMGLPERDRDEFRSCFGEVLGLESPPDEAPSPEPEVRRGHLIHYLKGLLAHRASQRPLIIVMEDAHWIDETSVEIIRQCLSDLDSAPILLITVYRPEHAFGWEGKPYYRLLSLTRLTDEQSEMLLDDLLDEKMLPWRARAAILEKTEGNPFFLEETVTSLQEAGALVAAEKSWRVEGRLSQAEIPGSIQRLLMARLDRLDADDRRVLQAAAVLGREAPYAILLQITAMGNVGEAQLEARLMALRRHGLIEETSPPLSPRRLWRYTFRHSLIQEVAYASLAVDKRQRYHRQIGEVIESLGATLDDLYPQRQTGHIELLAYHYYRSVAKPDQEKEVSAEATPEELTKAADYLLEAGKQARRRYANREAIAFYEQAAALMDASPQALAARKATCYEGLGEAHHLLGQFDSALDNFERAFSLLVDSDDSERASDRRQAADIAARIGRVYERQGGRDNLDAALKWRDRGLALLPETPTAEAALLHALGGIVDFRKADFSQADRQFERALDIAQQVGAKPERRLAHSMLSMSLHAQGHLDQAMEHCEISIALDKELSDQVGLAKDYSNQGAYAFEMDDWALARTSYEQALDVLERIEDKYQLAITNCNLADLYCHLGEPTRGLPYAQRGLELFTALSSYQGMIFARAVLATLYWRREELDQARTHLLEARELEEAHDVDMFRPTVGRWLAEVHLDAGAIDQAEREIEALLALDTDVLADEAEPIQRLHGLILAARGKLDRATQVLCASLARLEERQMRYQAGRALLALASVLAQTEGRAAEAKSHAIRARDIFADLGAELDRREAETMIRRNFSAL